jgi:hypothetical protein
VDLKKLKQDRLLREYVKEFSSLILDIENMSEDDRLFNFLSSYSPRRKKSCVDKK